MGMTNQLETAKEWLSDLNKIIDKTDNECTKQKRDVLEWLVNWGEVIEELIEEKNELQMMLKEPTLLKRVVELEKENQRYKQTLEEIKHITRYDDGREEEVYNIATGALEESE